MDFDPIATLSIIGAVIFLVFINEFRDTFLKIANIKGVKLWIPLLWISWLVEDYNDFIHTFIFWLHANLHLFLLYVSSIWSSKFSIYITKVAFLWLFGMIPLLILYWRAHFHFTHRFTARYIPKKHPIAHRAYLLLWVVICVLVVVN